MNTALKLLAPFSLALSLLAQTPAAPPAPTEAPTPLQARAFRHAGFLAKKLNLTEEQKAALKTIAQKHRDELKAKHQGLKEARQAYQAVMADPNAKETDIQNAHRLLSQRALDTALAARSLRSEMRAVLTPDQQVQADKLREEFKARHQERMMHLRKGLGLGLAG